MIEPYHQDDAVTPHEGEVWEMDRPDPSESYPDLRDLEIARLRVALTGYAIPKLEFCAARFREMANEKMLPEPWRNACSLWAMLTNSSLESIASVVMGHSCICGLHNGCPEGGHSDCECLCVNPEDQ